MRAQLVDRAGSLLHKYVLRRNEVRALDATQALSGEADAVRIILAGSGITSGWGVSTHGLALVGAVRRSLQRLLAAPVDVEQESRVGALLSDAPALLAARLTEPADVVVLAFGWSDVFALTPVHTWAETLEGVLDVHARDHPGIPVVIVGLPPMDQLGIARLLGPLVRRHGERLNAASIEVVARRSGGVYVPLSAPANRAARPWGSPEAYDAWSVPIAAALVSVLEDGCSERGSRPVVAPDDHLEDLSSASAVVPLLDRVRRAVLPSTRPVCGGPSPSRANGRPRTATRLLDRLRMRTWIHTYAMRVLDDLGHPPLVSDSGAPYRTLVVGARPLRVLFFGAGLAMGYGVQARSDAVDGAFARWLADASGRGVVLENRAAQHLRLENTSASLGQLRTYTYDLAIWFPSFTDGLEHLQPSWWRRHLHAMIRALRETEHVPLLLTHMPVPAGVHPAAIIARPWVHRLNRIIEQVAAEWDDVATSPTAPFFPAEIGQKVTDRAYFRAVGRALLPVATELLDGSRTTTARPEAVEVVRGH